MSDRLKVLRHLKNYNLQVHLIASLAEHSILIAKTRCFRWILLKKHSLCRLDMNTLSVCGNFPISPKYLIFKQAQKKFK